MDKDISFSSLIRKLDELWSHTYLPSDYKEEGELIESKTTEQRSTEKDEQP